MSNTTVKHCDNCGGRMSGDYAKFVMPAVPTPVNGVPAMVVTPWHGDAPIGYAHAAVMISRIYDICEDCTRVLTKPFVGIGEEVKTRIDDEQQARHGQRFAQVMQRAAFE